MHLVLSNHRTLLDSMHWIGSYLLYAPCFHRPTVADPSQSRYGYTKQPPTSFPALHYVQCCHYERKQNLSLRISVYHLWGDVLVRTCTPRLIAAPVCVAVAAGAEPCALLPTVATAP